MFSACSCNNDYSRGVGCNVLTGQCECLPGVVGEKCDACPYRWVLVSDQGCHDCDICHHNLLDVTDSLDNELKPIIDDFQTVAGGFFTSQKLKYFNELADKIEPDVKNLDPSSINLSPLTTSIEALESEAKVLDRKLQYANQTVNDQLVAGNKLLNDSRNVLTETRKTFENIQNSIYEVQKLADSFDASDSTKAENAIADANEMLDLLRENTIDTTPSEKSYESSAEYLKEIEQFASPINDQKKKLDNLHTNIRNFTNKLDNLNQHAREAIRISYNAGALHSKNKDASVNAKFETANNHTKETRSNIDGTIISAKSGNITLGEIYRFLKNLENVNNELKSINTQVDKELPTKSEEYDALDYVIAESAKKREQLVELVHTIEI